MGRDIQQFQADLKNGMSLEKALQKHGLTLPLAMELTAATNTKKRKKRNKNWGYAGLYIQERDKKFYVRKWIKGKYKMFGTYDKLEDAEKIRDYMMEHGWKQRKVDEACELLGIERVKNKQKTRYH